MRKKVRELDFLSRSAWLSIFLLPFFIYTFHLSRSVSAVDAVRVLLLRVDGDGLVDCHKLYLRCRIAVPIVVCGYPKVPLKQPRELLAQ